VKSFSRYINEPQFVLACEHGGDLKLMPVLDEKRKDLVASYAITEESVELCPVR